MKSRTPISVLLLPELVNLEPERKGKLRIRGSNRRERKACAVLFHF